MCHVEISVERDFTLMQALRYESNQWTIVRQLGFVAEDNTWTGVMNAAAEALEAISNPNTHIRLYVEPEYFWVFLAARKDYKPGVAKIAPENMDAYNRLNKAMQRIAWACGRTGYQFSIYPSDAAVVR